jgi:hypothetical protein
MPVVVGAQETEDSCAFSRERNCSALRIEIESKVRPKKDSPCFESQKELQSLLQQTYRKSTRG